ncbi:MAG: T9SS type A sorting domain-containing protein [Bacteroidetes bacterium]|nr:T9SS type A sorting domain-containing protein [Bacteroidota bacterium]
MKGLLRLLLLLISNCTLYSQTEIFNHTYDFDGDVDDGRQIFINQVGNYVIYSAGYCEPEDYDCRRFIEINPQGEIVNLRLIEDIETPTDAPFSMIQAKDGGYFYAYSKSYPETGFDMHIYKINEKFEPIWEKKIVYAKDDYIKNLVETPGGDVVACGWTESFPQSNYRQSFLLRVDGTTQEVEWFKLLKESSINYAVTIVEDEQYNFLIGGLVFDIEEDDLNAYILKTDSLGNEISWYEVPGIIPDEESLYPWDSFPTIVTHPGGGFVYEINFDYKDMYKGDKTAIIRFHYNEQEEYTEDWRLFLDAKRSQYVSSIKIAQNGDIIGCGNDINNPFKEGNSTGLLLRISPEGELRWLRQIIALDGTHEALGYRFRDLVEDSLQNIVLSGLIRWVDTVYYDVWLVRTDADGCLYESSCTDPLIFTNGIEDVESSRAGISVYPNPASEAIQIQSPEAIQRITLYNSTGARVKELEVSGREISLAVGELPNGIYIANLQTIQGENIYRKLVVQH